MIIILHYISTARSFVALHQKAPVSFSDWRTDCNESTSPNQSIVSTISDYPKSYYLPATAKSSFSYFNSIPHPHAAATAVVAVVPPSLIFFSANRNVF
jgi:hypothetical protein